MSDQDEYPEFDEMQGEFPWKADIPQEMLDVLGEKDPRMTEHTEQFTELIEHQLAEAISTLNTQAAVSLSVVVDIVKKHTGCSELAATEVINDILPWTNTIASVDIAGAYVAAIDKTQLGLGVEENSRLAATYINHVSEKLSRHMSETAVEDFERRFLCTPEEYLEMTALVLGLDASEYFRVE